MSYIGPGGTIGNVPVWDGSKWVSQVTSAGGTSAISPSIFHSKSVQWLNVYDGSSGSVAVVGWSTTAVVATNDNPTWTKTDTYLGHRLIGWRTGVSTAGTNILVRNGGTGANGVFFGNTAGIGGFYWKGRLGTTSNSQAWASTQGIFMGLRNAITNPAGGTSPSAFVDCVGIGHDPSDTNLQLMYNDSAGTCTKVDLGSSFTLADKQLYDSEIYVAPNSSVINYKVTNVLTGNTTSGATTTTNTPTVNTALTWVVYATNGSTAVTIGVAVGGQYLELN